MEVYIYASDRVTPQNLGVARGGVKPLTLPGFVTALSLLIIINMSHLVQCFNQIIYTNK